MFFTDGEEAVVSALIGVVSIIAALALGVVMFVTGAETGMLFSGSLVLLALFIYGVRLVLNGVRIYEDTNSVAKGRRIPSEMS